MFDAIVVPPDVEDTPAVLTRLGKGDVPGHEFHGNQWTSGGGGVAGATLPVHDLLARVKATGGFTYSPFSGRTPARGFALSIFPEHSKVLDMRSGKLTGADLRAYLKANAGLLRGKGNYMGGWHDREDGKFYLDVSRVVNSHAEAVALSQRYSQKAYFGLHSGKEYDANGNELGKAAGEAGAHPDPARRHGRGAGSARGPDQRGPGGARPQGVADPRGLGGPVSKQHSREYLEQVVASARRYLPAWMMQRIHQAALPSAGGRARHRIALDDPTSSDVHVDGTMGPVRVQVPRKRRPVAAAKDWGAFDAARLSIGRHLLNEHLLERHRLAGKTPDQLASMHVAAHAAGAPARGHSHGGYDRAMRTGETYSGRPDTVADSQRKSDPTLDDVHYDTPTMTVRELAAEMAARSAAAAAAAMPDDEPETGVMVALFPAAADVARLEAVALEDADDLHLTLCYLGQVADMGPATVARLIAAVVEWAEDQQPLAGRVSGVGRFHAGTGPGSEAGQDVVYASVDAPALPDARQSLVDALDEAGVDYAQDHGFTPHITLAYVPAGAPSPADAARLEPFDLTFGAVTVAVGGEYVTVPLGFASDEGYEPGEDDDEDDMPEPGELAFKAEAAPAPSIEVADDGAWTATAALWKADGAERQVVYGVVLTPELVDSQGDVVGADEIEKAAHDFMLQYQESGVQHEGEALPELRVIESYIAPQAMEVGGKQVMKGSWVMAVKVLDPAVWDLVKSGRLTGFSIQGTAMREEIAA